MAGNVVQTIWRLILDENEANKSQSAVESLATAVQDKLGNASTTAIDKTTEAIQNQTAALKEEEAQAGKTVDAMTPSSGSSSGSASSLISKFSGVGRMAGINVEQIAGIARAAEGVQQLAEAAGVLEGASAAAGAAGTAAAPGLLASAAGFGAIMLPLLPLIAALGVASLAFGELQKQTEAANEALQRKYDAEDEVDAFARSGATVSDALKRQTELQDEVTDATKRYNEAQAAAAEDFKKRASVPLLGDFTARLQDAVNVNSTDDKQTKRLEETKAASEAAAAKLAELNKQLKEGAFAADDRKKADEKTAKDTEKAARDQEQAAAKQKATQEKSASDAQHLIEQAAAKEQQANEKRYQAAQKYSDSLIDIARHSADDAKKALAGLKEKLADNQGDFQRDIADLSTEFHDSEREEAIKRGEQEVQDAIAQTNKLKSIRDEALASEQGFLRKRDFLSAANVREAANTRIEQENKTFLEAQAEKQHAQQNEDAAQLRQLDKARHERLQALDRANAEAKLAYTRDIANQKEARHIAEREAAIARNREIRAANDAARAVLGIKQQQSQTELQLARATLTQLRGMTTINNGNTMNGNITLNTSLAGGGMTLQQVDARIMQTLGKVGLA